MILNPFDILILGVAIYLNWKIWKSAPLSKSLIWICFIISIVMFGFIFPITSIYVELMMAKSKKLSEFTSVFCATYILGKWIIFWSLGVIDLFVKLVLMATPRNITSVSSGLRRSPEL